MNIHQLIHLPPANCRWTAERKLQVLKAIDAEQLSRTTALSYYGLSAEELDEWRALYESQGFRALYAENCNATRKQQLLGGTRDRIAASLPIGGPARGPT